VAVAAVACSGGERGGGGDFTINTYQSGGVLDGRETTLQAVLDQGKPVVLNFWAGNCPPCRAEMPVLEDGWKAFKDEVSIVGVDVGPFFRLGTDAQAISLIREMGVSYPTGNSRTSSILEDFNLNGLPGTFFMKPDGTIQDTWPGAISGARLNQKIKALIEASAS
jgi:thiol-disulfide isomerase/thioredoxin